MNASFTQKWKDALADAQPNGDGSLLVKTRYDEVSKLSPNTPILAWILNSVLASSLSMQLKYDLRIPKMRFLPQGFFNDFGLLHMFGLLQKEKTFRIETSTHT